jgi:hypothetical protein
VAIGLTVGTAVLILAVLFLLPVGTGIVAYLTKHGHLGWLGTVLVNVVRYALALALLFLIVSMIYYFGPCIKQKYQAITPGAVFTVAVWILLGLVFGFYVTHFGNFNKTYGALGGAIILLLFFYINAVVLLIGAELNSVIDFETLNVKPGATDLSQASAKAEYDTKHAGEPKARPQGLAGEHGAAEQEPVHLPILPAPARTHRARNLVIVTSSFLAARWTWRAVWRARAKRKRRELLARARQPWWRRLVAG